LGGTYSVGSTGLTLLIPEVAVIEVVIYISLLRPSSQ